MKSLFFFPRKIGSLRLGSLGLEGQLGGSYDASLHNPQDYKKAATIRYFIHIPGENKFKSIICEVCLFIQERRSSQGPPPNSDNVATSAVRVPRQQIF